MMDLPRADQPYVRNPSKQRDPLKSLTRDGQASVMEASDDFGSRETIDLKRTPDLSEELQGSGNHVLLFDSDINTNFTPVSSIAVMESQKLGSRPDEQQERHMEPNEEDRTRRRGGSSTVSSITYETFPISPLHVSKPNESRGKCGEVSMNGELDTLSTLSGQPSKSSKLAHGVHKSFDSNMSSESLQMPPQFLAKNEITMSEQLMIQEKRIGDLQHEITSLLQEKLDLENLVEITQDKYREERSHLQQNFARVANENSRLQDRVEKLNETAANTEHYVEELQKHSDDCSERASNSEKRMQDLKTELECIQRTSRDLESSSAKRLIDAQKLQEEHEALQKAYKDLRESYDDEVRVNTNTGLAIDEIRSEKRKIEIDKDKEIKQLRLQIEKSPKRSAFEFNDDLDDNREDIVSLLLHNQVQDLNNSVLAKELENESLRKYVADAANKLKDMVTSEQRLDQFQKAIGIVEDVSSNWDIEEDSLSAKVDNLLELLQTIHKNNTSLKTLIDKDLMEILQEFAQGGQLTIKQKTKVEEVQKKCQQMMACPLVRLHDTVPDLESWANTLQGDPVTLTSEALRQENESLRNLVQSYENRMHHMNSAFLNMNIAEQDVDTSLEHDIELKRRIEKTCEAIEGDVTPAGSRLNVDENQVKMAEHRLAEQSHAPDYTDLAQEEIMNINNSDPGDGDANTDSTSDKKDSCYPRASQAREACDHHHHLRDSLPTVSDAWGIEDADACVGEEPSSGLSASASATQMNDEHESRFYSKVERTQRAESAKLLREVRSGRNPKAELTKASKDTKSLNRRYVDDMETHSNTHAAIVASDAKYCSVTYLLGRMKNLCSYQDFSKRRGKLKNWGWIVFSILSLFSVAYIWNAYIDRKIWLAANQGTSAQFWPAIEYEPSGASRLLRSIMELVITLPKDHNTLRHYG